MSADDAQLLAAHEAGDYAHMIALYREAAATATGAERAFLLTQAHVYAMDIGHPDAATLRAELVALGRELPL